tara:strand:+ start:535 stop:939 length:405 start_codon:yes stop_codon:yes gene_type:complete
MYGRINSIDMNSFIIQNFRILCLFLIFLYSSNLNAFEKSITYKCTGLSEFELIGSSGKKEEVKSKEYNFIDGVLHDLNQIQCNWENNKIKCESNFLNIRKLTINLKSNEISDYISGNKGFGVYVENFKGECQKK